MTNETRPAVQHIDLDETLRRMKAELRREFPGVRFSVTRSRGTAYGYVSVRWTDGPTDAEVTAVVKMYEGEGFDGMTDSSYRIEHTAADAQGNPVVLRYGTRGILTHREISPARKAKATRAALRLFGDWGTPAGLPPAAEYAETATDAEVLANAWRYDNGVWCGVDTMAHRILSRSDWLPQEILDATADI